MSVYENFYKGEQDSVIDKLIDKDFSVKWKEVWPLPAFNDLKSTPHNRKWHQEGPFVSDHVKPVVDQVYLLPEWDTISRHTKTVMLLAALFHDIGKAHTLKVNEEGDNSFPGHATYGEKMTRYILWDEDFDVREDVCRLIRYHQHLYNAAHGKIELDKTIIEISTNSNVEMLCMLTKCDKLGSISSQPNIMADYLKVVEQRAKELNCWNTPYIFPTEQHKLLYFRGDITLEEIPTTTVEPTRSTVYVMCGGAGAGKDTWIKDNLPSNLTQVSRDAVRGRMLDRPGIKTRFYKKEEDFVSIFCDMMMEGYLTQGVDFAVNNTHIRKSFRDELVKKLLRYNARIVYIYVETSKDKCAERRKEQIPASTVAKMQREIDFPYESECHNIIHSRN